MIKEGKRRPNHLTDDEKLGEWSLKLRKSLKISKKSEKDTGSMMLGDWVTKCQQQSDESCLWPSAYFYLTHLVL